MVLAELRDRFPALDSWVMQVQGLLDPRRVLLALVDEALNLACWSQNDWASSNLVLPPDLCRFGQPLNSEALGETIADLLLEQGLSLPQVEVELLLPLASCQWRLLEGAASSLLQHLNQRITGLEICTGQADEHHNLRELFDLGQAALGVFHRLHLSADWLYGLCRCR